MRKKIGILGAAALALATMSVSAEQVNIAPQQQQTTNQQNRKEALPVKNVPTRTVSSRNSFGGFSQDPNFYKHIRKDGRNQRQYRKWLRSNPQMRRSKKSK